MTTYTDTGQKSLIILTYNGNQGVNRCTVSAGASDVYSVEVQQTKDAQRVAIPTLKTLSNTCLFEVPAGTYAIGLNITTNASGSIILDVNPV